MILLCTSTLLEYPPNQLRLLYTNKLSKLINQEIKYNFLKQKKFHTFVLGLYFICDTQSRFIFNRHKTDRVSKFPLVANNPLTERSFCVKKSLRQI